MRGWLITEYIVCNVDGISLNITAFIKVAASVVESYPEIMVKFFKRKCCKYVLTSDTYEFRYVIIIVVTYYPFCSG